MSRPTVLVVEDDAGLRLALEHGLIAEGFEVAVAPDARTACERAAATRAAERSLAAVAALAAGHGVRTGRELTPALFALAPRVNALPAADRAQAHRYFLRPTDPRSAFAAADDPRPVLPLMSCTSKF